MVGSTFWAEKRESYWKFHGKYCIIVPDEKFLSGLFLRQMKYAK